MADVGLGERSIWPLPTLQYTTQFRHYSRQVRIAAFVVFAVFPAMFLLMFWYRLLGITDWGLVVLVEGVVVGLGVVVYVESFRASDSTLVLNAEKVELGYGRKVKTMQVPDMIGIVRYFLLGDEVIVLRGLRSHSLAFGAGLSASERDEIHRWLSELGRRNRIPIIADADEKDLLQILKADDSFWLHLKKRISQRESRDEI